jgi:hypothetical protein
MRDAANSDLACPSRNATATIALAVLVPILLAGCSGTATRGPSASVEYPWQAISSEQSELAIGGPDDHRHRAHQNGSRYQESVTFTNGAAVWYELLQGTHAVFDQTGGEIIKGWYNGVAAKAAGFVYKTDPVRRNGEAFSLTDSGTTRTCSLHGRVFGMTEAGYGQGDQLYLITYCIPSGPNAAATTERVVNELVARVAATPVFAKRPPTLLLTPAPSGTTS